VYLAGPIYGFDHLPTSFDAGKIALVAWTVLIEKEV
jgi:hypothetical protein